MKEYRVKVTELHTDHVWIKAESEEDAKELAHNYAECEYETLYDCEVMEERETK